MITNVRIAGRALVVTCVMVAAVTTGSRDGSATGTQPPPAPNFVATIAPIADELAAEMSGVSWHPGCPVAIEDLRLVRMPYWGFDGQIHDGELVVHTDVAYDVAGVFGGMFTARFPIARMELIESYGGDDDASMAADNTSAFNCREITGGGSWSIHSYGKAIDINPLENPYVRGGTVLPAAGAEFLDRSDVRPGMIVAGDAVVAAFRSIGFEWGGDWSRLQDYQHFEAANPSSGSQRGDAGCPTYSDNAGRYPVRMCQSGAVVRQVQRQLVRHGFAISIDGRFGPVTEAAVREFQGARGLPTDGIVGTDTWEQLVEAGYRLGDRTLYLRSPAFRGDDVRELQRMLNALGFDAGGLVGPLTWPALSAGAVSGSDADGNGVVDPWEVAPPTLGLACSALPASDVWAGDVAGLVDRATGHIDVTTFNDFLAGAGASVAASPCDAARMLLHLERPLDEGTIVILVVEPDGTVTATLDRLADDSVRAVRYGLVFADAGGALHLDSATWTQRCQSGRGHDDFSIEPCI